MFRVISSSTHIESRTNLMFVTLRQWQAISTTTQRFSSERSFSRNSSSSSPSSLGFQSSLIGENDDEESTKSLDQEDYEDAAQQKQDAADSDRKWKDAKKLLDQVPEFIEHTLSINRTCKVTKGGKNLHYKALVVVGDGKGRIGFSTGAGADGRQATEKAQKKAREVLMEVPLWRNRSIYNDVKAKYSATKVMIGRGKFGSGITANRVQYLICDAVGIRDAVCKVWGSTNPANILHATLKALSHATSIDRECQMRGLDRRKYINAKDDKRYDDRLYRGEPFTFKELTGVDSQFDMIGVFDPEEDGFAVTSSDGGIPKIPGRSTNPEIYEWDAIAEANERKFWSQVQALGVNPAQILPVDDDGDSAQSNEEKPEKKKKAEKKVEPPKKGADAGKKGADAGKKGADTGKKK